MKGIKLISKLTYGSRWKACKNDVWFCGNKNRKIKMTVQWRVDDETELPEYDGGISGPVYFTRCEDIEFPKNGYWKEVPFIPSPQPAKFTANIAGFDISDPKMKPQDN